MAHPSERTQVVIAVAVVLLVVAFFITALFHTLLWSSGGDPVFLRRTVDASAIRGVETRHRFRCMERARRRLRSLGDTPAIIVQRGAFWYVLAGPQLTVTPGRPPAEGSPSVEYVVVEFTVRSQPAVAPAPAASAAAPTPAPAMTQVVMIAPGKPATAREVRGRSGAVLLASIDTTQPVRGFPTLEQAVAAARPFDRQADTVDYIVGGSHSHPMYYVVTVVRTNEGGEDAALGDANGPPDSHIWVRVE